MAQFLPRCLSRIERNCYIRRSAPRNHHRGRKANRACVQFVRDLKGDNSFTVVFYGLTIFACKTAQFCVTLRESEMAETPSVSNAAQAGENTRKNSFLNYKSAALPTELCRRCPCESRFSELIKTSSDDRAASRNIRYSPDEISSLLTLRAHAHAMVFVGCCLLRLSVATVL
jgi:hypothetical protein